MWVFFQKINPFNGQGVNAFFFVWSFSSHLRICQSFGDFTFADEELQVLNYASHIGQLSSEGSLACHTFCDIGHLFIMVISEDM